MSTAHNHRKKLIKKCKKEARESTKKVDWYKLFRERVESHVVALRFLDSKIPIIGTGFVARTYTP